jgi:predicted acylesterase/phospholipase RssA
MPLTKKYGVYKGNAIEKKIRSLVKPSFYDMICDLHIYCTDIQRNSTVVFSRLQYELMESYNLDVATCVRASLSLPFIFDYVECKDRENRRMILVDGGVTNNFPMDAASYKPRQLDMHRKLPHETSPKVSNTNVIGIRVQSKQETAYNAKCTSSLSTFAQANLSSMMEALENQHVPTELWPRVITIQTQESSLNLNLSRQEALHLYQEGYDQTTLALRTRIEL